MCTEILNYKYYLYKIGTIFIIQICSSFMQILHTECVLNINYIIYNRIQIQQCFKLLIKNLYSLYCKKDLRSKIGL